jgi:hypothetical protein
MIWWVAYDVPTPLSLWRVGLQDQVVVLLHLAVTHDGWRMEPHNLFGETTQGKGNDGADTPIAQSNHPETITT